MNPLSKGISIIEASAGTGKTYTLCRIALTLIVEKDIPIDRILTVTFTQAATEELTARIREVLRRCLMQLEANKVEERDLISILERGGATVEEAQRRLRHSLEIFDEAPISTIHGFCRRSLELVSLETDTAFEANLEHIEDELIDRLRNEFLRIHILERSPLFCALFAGNAKVTKRLKTIGKEFAVHPYARLEPQGVVIDNNALESSFQATIETIPDLLECADALIPHLNKRGKLTQLLGDPKERDALRALVLRKQPRLSDVPRLDRLTRDNWKKAKKKSAEGLEVPVVFDRVDAFFKQARFALDALVAQYREWLFEQLRNEKERRNILSFNDLLHLLNRALLDDPEGTIARSISDRYDAALVDEFQDTDPVQYNIVQQLFGNDAKYLFLIGDPKQAIYRFRGADIFAYFKAIGSEHFERIELSHNFRSTPTLVRAVNALFENAPDGFAFEQIAFSPVAAAKESEAKIPLQIRALSEGENPVSPSKASVRLLARAAARDLAQRITAEPQLDRGAVAFLVSRNDQADELATALAQQDIDAIIKAERSVFKTEEATTLACLLETLANPSSLRTRRALFLTSLVGYHWTDLLRPDFDERSYRIESFLQDWSRNWNASQFDAHFNHFLNLTHTSERLLGQPEGERRYANLCQLGELLQDEARTRRSTPQHLLAWLESKKDESVTNHEEWQTRLRSDGGKPQIVTIHKSKGLEFPIVICPFLSLLSPKPNPDYALYHASEQGDQLVINLDPEENSAAIEATVREEYAEHLRLIYVALTRASQECVLYLTPEEWTASKKSPPSSFCQLVLGSKTAQQLLESKTATSAMLKRLQTLDPPSIELEIRSMDTLSSEAIDETPVESTSAAPRVEPRSSQGIRIPQPERILSFSTISQLAHSGESPIEEIANDEALAFALEPEPVLPAEFSSDPTLPSIFNLPKGAHTGNLFHAIMEAIDFQVTHDLKDLIAEVFDRLRYGRPEYRTVLQETIESLLSLKLPAENVRFSLDEIPSQKRITELEFAYPTTPDALSRLSRVFNEKAPATMRKTGSNLSSLNSTSIKASLMRGFIDLVVEREGTLYLFDWKSNHLGDQPEDYAPSALRQAMLEHDYHLQYCLYCVALKRHIEQRTGQNDFYPRFGGVFYLFVRGIKANSDNGVYFDRPSKDLIDALDASIAR